jgi:transglutaminase-like putative cysteine protease
MRLRLTIAAATATLLGSIGLYPLFDSARWVWPGLGAILMVSGTGLLTRRYRVPVTVAPVAGLAALLVYVTMLHAADAAIAGIVPTPSSLARLADLVNAGGDVINRYAAPVPLVPGIALLATLGIGLVALTVDFLAVRLRYAAPAGLPLLAMYSVPAAVREESINWIAFLLGAVGFLGLLLADSREQVSGWGRPVFTRRWSEATSRERPDSSALAVTGHRIGLTAVAIAVLVPAIVPGLHPRNVFGAGGSGPGSGNRTVTTPDALVSLRRELTRQSDAIVLTYTTNDIGRPDYLRMYALDRFDGNRWTYSAVEGATVEEHGIPAVPGLRTAPVRPVTTNVKVEDRVRDMSFLPLPYPPTQVAIKGDWRVNPPSLMVYSLRDAAGGRDYRVQSLRVLPTAEQLAAAPAEAPPPGTTSEYITVPDGVPDKIKDLAKEKTEGAATPYDKAMRLQDWFTRSGEFSYNLNTRSPQRVSDLVDFLTISKEGYCEQFAASMALLARIIGIPARVAMGYTAGTQVSDGSWVVRSGDAHAWPELFFDGVGWVRFEPTPAGVAGQGTASVPSYALPAATSGGSGSGGQASPSPSSSPGASAGAAPSQPPGGRRADELNQLAGNSADPLTSDQGVSLAWPAGILLILLILATPMGVHAVSRRRRWAYAGPPHPRQSAGAVDATRVANAGWTRLRMRPRRSTGAVDAVRLANAAWTQLRTDAIDHGLPWRPSDSPRAVARRLIEHLRLGGAAAESLIRIARAEELARYSRAPESPASLRADVRLVRKAFSGSVSSRTRWRARLAPPSAMALLRNAGGRVLEAFDLLDTVGSRLGKAIQRR